MSTVSGGRRRAFRSRHHTPMGQGGKLAVLFVSLALVLFVFAVMLGNHLRSLAVEIIEDTTEPSTTEPQVYYANPPEDVIARGIVFGVDYFPLNEDTTEETSTLTDADTTEASPETDLPESTEETDLPETEEITDLSEDPIRFDAVSLVLRERDVENGNIRLAYSSPLSMEYSIDIAGSVDLYEGMEIIRSNWGERTKICGILEIDYLNRPQELRGVMRAYEVALVCELIDAGFDELLLLGFSDYTDEGLAFISDIYEKKGRGTVIGLGLSFNYITSFGAKEKIGEIAKKCGFLALDLYSQDVPVLMTAEALIADKVSRTLSICREYSIRILAGCGESPDFEAQTRAAINAGADNIMTGLGLPMFVSDDE